MAKAISSWVGYDSFGRRVQVAKSESKKFYCRAWKWNGYAMAWEKWQKMEDRPRHFLNLDGQIEFGFSALDYIGGSELRLRLPS